MKTRSLRPALAIAATVALLAVAGCMDDETTDADGEAPATPGVVQQGTPGDEEADPGAEAEDETDEAGADSGDEATEGDPAAGADGDVPPEYDGVLAAIDLAVAEHDGAPAFEVDDGDGGIWEVHVAVGDDDIEVHVSAEGTEILSSEREADLDSDDREGLAAAGDFTLADAVRAAIIEYGGTASVDDVTISDESQGEFAWEVAFTDDVEVYLDIATGDVLRVETD